jgi:hypothetical protein
MQLTAISHSNATTPRNSQGKNEASVSPRLVGGGLQVGHDGKRRQHEPRGRLCGVRRRGGGVLCGGRGGALWRLRRGRARGQLAGVAPRARSARRHRGVRRVRRPVHHRRRGRGAVVDDDAAAARAGAGAGEPAGQLGGQLHHQQRGRRRREPLPPALRRRGPRRLRHRRRTPAGRRGARPPPRRRRSAVLGAAGRRHRRRPGRWRRRGRGGGGAGEAGAAVPREAQEPKVQEDHPLCVAQGLRRGKAQDQGPLRQARPRRRRTGQRRGQVLVLLLRRRPRRQRRVLRRRRLRSRAELIECSRHLAKKLIRGRLVVSSSLLAARAPAALPTKAFAQLETSSGRAPCTSRRANGAIVLCSCRHGCARYSW